MKTHLKKGLSIVLSLLMIVTSLVIAPEMFSLKASAVSSGDYTVTLNITVTNKADSTGNIQDSYYKVYYKPNNGKDTETYKKFDIKDYLLSETTKNVPFTVPGFPTKLEYYHDAVWTDRVFYKVNSISVCGSPQTSPNKEIRSGGVGNDAASGNFTWTLDYPYAQTAEIVDQPSAITISANSTPSEKTFTARVKDQYGVVISSDATTYSRTVSLTPTTTFTSPDSDTGMSVAYKSTASAKDTFKISAANGAKKKNIDEFKEKATVTYTFNGHSASVTTNEFTVYDPEYSFTLDNKGGSLTTPTTNPITKKYYNQYGYNPVATKTGFTLIGYYNQANGDASGNYFVENPNPSGTKLVSTTKIEADTTWYAAWKANKYTQTFVYKDQNNYDAVADFNSSSHSEPVTGYYSLLLAPPTIPTDINVGKSVYNGVTYYDYTYTFTGWSPSVPERYPSNAATYTAQYETITPHYADYTALDAQIVIANRIKSDTSAQAGGNNFYNEGGYTDASKAAFDTALRNATKLSRTKLKSAQTEVDGIKDALESAIANLTLKEYNVMFTDEEGAIIRDGFYTVPYGGSVTVPTAPKKENNNNYHYNFDGWNTDATTMQTQLNCITQNYKYVAEFTAESHEEYWEEEKVPSTCTSDGVTKYTCTKCGYSYTAADPDDEASHLWSTEKVVIKAATCYTEGIKAYKCTRCDVVDNASVETIAKTAHNWTEWNTLAEATCTDDGVKVRNCQNVGCTAQQYETISATGHTWATESTVDFDSTCTEPGQRSINCTVCGECKPGSTEEIEPKDHDFSGDFVIDYDAQCETAGLKHKECSRCSLKSEYEVISAKDHTWSEWAVNSNATCTETGSKSRNCSACSKEETETIPAIGHNYKNKDDVEYVEPTCYSSGYWDCPCQNIIEGEQCNSVNRIYNEGTATGHDWQLVEDPTLTYPETCESAGQNYYRCKYFDNCGGEKEEVISAKGHDYADATTENYIEPTCARGGYWVLPCKNGCGDQKYVMDEAHPAINEHTWYTNAAGTADYDPTEPETDADGWLLAALTEGGEAIAPAPEAATCTKDGTHTRICGVCGYVDTVTIAKSGHNWVVTTLDGDTLKTEVGTTSQSGVKYVEPDCNHGGYWILTCQNGCGTSVIIDNTGAVANNEHIWNLNTTSVDSENNPLTYAPTCTNSGANYYVCERNSAHTKTEVVPALGHDYVVEPIYSELNIYGTELKAEDAEYADYFSYVAADCTHGGYWTITCKTCGDTVEVRDESTQAKGHTWMESIPGEADVAYLPNGATESNGWLVKTAAACTTDGEAIRKCSVCAHEESKHIPKLGHDWGEWEITTPATNDADGEMTRTCSRGCTETAVIPAGGGHVYDMENPVVITPATCHSEGVQRFPCNVHTDCGVYIEAVIPVAPHDVITYVVSEKCTEDGYVLTYCSCWEAEGEDKYANINAYLDGTLAEGDRPCEFIPNKTVTYALGHDYDYDNGVVTVEPTCIGEGVKTVTCKRPGCTDAEEDHTITSPVPAKGHTYVLTVTEPTCTEAGYTTHTCNVCDDGTEGKIYIDTYTQPAGHAFGNWGYDNATDKPTCTDNGVETRHCTRTGCTAYEQRYVDALGHTWIVDANTDANGWRKVVEGNCVTPRQYSRECEVCHKIETKSVTVPNGHNYKYNETVAPTCVENGYELWVCQNDGCNSTEHREVTDPLGHDWGYWHITKYPNGAENGTQERVCKRAGCGAKKTIEVITGKYYLVNFFDSKGNRVIEPAYYAYNTEAKKPETAPAKQPDSGYTYEFDKWDLQESDGRVLVTGNMAVKPVYTATERTYATVTYKDENGRVIATKTNVKYTEIQTAVAKPLKDGDVNYTYEFASWNVTYNTSNPDNLTAVATATFTATAKPKVPENKNFFQKIIDWFKNLFASWFGW